MNVNTIQKVNMRYMDQVTYLQGYHRSGWPFVLRQLFKLHSDTATVKMDTYVDRTFHWLKPMFLPYIDPWVGFVHHTFNTQYSSYNCVELLKNQQFLDSLPHCKGLFVFTTELRDRWITELEYLGYMNIPVQALFHPTEEVPMVWDQQAYESNNEKFIVQIGAWLRDNYAIYRLNNGKPKLGQLQKAALKGPNMDHYFKPNGFFEYFRPSQWKSIDATNTGILMASDSDISDELTPNGTLPSDLVTTNPDDDQAGDDDGICRDNICRDIICRDSNAFLNKYVQGAIGLLKDYDESVVIIPTLIDAEYDDLLSKNVVFLKLHDAGAVNTIIECIVRNTPIVVNKIPSTIEYLGDAYPLYYERLDDIPELLTLENILSAHTYLVNMDKTFLQGQTFLDYLTNGPIYTSL